VAAPNRIRTSQEADRAAVLSLYPLAFPQEDLTGLVDALLGHTEVLNLSAVQNERLVGHMALALCQVASSPAPVALLGPLCVHPDLQRAGVGAALIESGALRLAQGGVSAIFVLGDPDYYTQRGFDRPSPVTAPYPLPEDWAEAWRIRVLDPQHAPQKGVLSVPAPWAQAELWG